MVNYPPTNAGDRDAGLNPGSGRSPGGGRGNCCSMTACENPKDRARGGHSRTQLKQLSIHTGTVNQIFLGKSLVILNRAIKLFLAFEQVICEYASNSC